MIGNSVLVYQGDFDVPLLAGHSHASQVPMLMLMQKRDTALSEASAALALDPQSPMLEAVLGATLLQLGRVQEANEAFSTAMLKAREHKPDDESQWKLRRSLRSSNLRTR
jgi:predicted Zn-dependent protease